VKEKIEELPCKQSMQSRIANHVLMTGSQIQHSFKLILNPTEDMRALKFTFQHANENKKQYLIQLRHSLTGYRDGTN
jgi:hypothetical protein